MAQVEIPAGLVPHVRETAFLLYRAAVEAMRLAVEAAEPDRGLRHERERVAGLDALLERLGWPGGGPPAHARPAAGAVELTASAELLRDVLHGALIDAGERLALACDASWRGEATGESVRAAAREVLALDRLLRRLDVERG